MRISLSTPQAFEFACHSKACAPPPAGRGGSDGGSFAGFRKVGGKLVNAKGEAWPGAKGYSKDGPEPYFTAKQGKRKNTTVTRDGTIAVTNGGGKLPRFRMRDNKSSKWVADKITTRNSAIRVRQQSVGWM